MTLIPNLQETLQVQSSGFEESFAMTMDEDSIVHLQAVLTNMYKDPMQAILREYTTNGLDAHRKAGQTRPVEVTLPNRLSNFYVVRDYGVGMDVEYMRKVYSRYGASDKRDDAESTGGYGIGSKSGLAYTNSFTVTAWQDGKRTRAIVSLDEFGAGKFDIVDIVESDEPVGVEVKISIKNNDVSFFNEKADRFFAFWPEGTVLVDGQAPRRDEGWTELDANTFYKQSRNYYYEDSYVRAGVVAYPVDFDSLPVAQKLRDARISFMLYTGPSDVAIAPNRESLIYTPATKRFIESRLDNLYDRVIQNEIDAINACTTYKEAWNRINDIPTALMNDGRLTSIGWNGAKWTRSHRLSTEYRLLNWDWYGDRCTADTRWNIDISVALSRTHLIVTGFEGKNISTAFKRKVRQYCEDNDIESADYSFIVNDDIDLPWLSDIPRVDAETIKAVKLPANQTARPKTKPKYDVYTEAGHTYTSDIDAKKKPLLFASPTVLKRDMRYGQTQKVNVVTMAADLDAVIVSLASNRHEKFKRDFPKAQPLEAFLQQRIKDLVVKANVGKVYNFDYMGYNVRQFLAKVDPSELLDEEIVKFAKSYQNKATGKNSDMDKAEGLFKNSQRGTLNIVMPTVETIDVEAVFDSRYPLVNCAYMEHSILYMNTVFERENLE